VETKAKNSGRSKNCKATVDPALAGREPTLVLNAGLWVGSARPLPGSARMSASTYRSASWIGTSRSTKEFLGEHTNLSPRRRVI